MLCLEIQEWEDTRDDALTFKGSAVLAGSNYTPILKHEMVKLSVVSSVANKIRRENAQCLGFTPNKPHTWKKKIKYCIF